MNDLMAKVKKYFSSNFGKLSLIIMGISFILTFLFSTLFRNRIDVSIMRAFISTVITGIILYALAIVLKKFLSDVIESSGVFDNNVSNTSDTSNTFLILLILLILLMMKYLIITKQLKKI